MMATTPKNEEPGFKHGVNELPEGQGSAFRSNTEEEPSGGGSDLEEAQQDAAHERAEKGGYQ